VTTSEALEDLTDPARFEILAIRVLRDLHPECHTLTHLGVNASGKTIRGAVDAFTLVPKSFPPKYVFAAFTLASRKELPRKWLAESTSSTSESSTDAEVGDLIKAGREAAHLRLRAPSSQFSVYLCTNRRLDHELMERVYGVARELSIDVVFLESSRLRDYLDSAAGQPAREEFLGLTASRVSRELVLKLGQLSLDHYQIEGFGEGQFVPTTAWREARNALTSPIPMSIIIGRPGAGKSIIARRLLEEQLGAGNMGLWVSEYILEHAVSVPDAIRLVLKQLNPGLGEDAGHETCALATPEHPLLLVFDDANRVASPGRVLTKILTWGRSLFDGKGDRESASIRVVLPIWEAYWANLHGQYEGTKWLQSQTIGPMLRDEAILCLRNRLETSPVEFSVYDLNEIAERLKDDPILLSIFARLIRDDPRADVQPLLEDTIGSFITSSLARLCLDRGTLETSYRSALLHLSRAMLLNRSLHPDWSELQEWFLRDPLSLSHLEHIAAHGHICAVVMRGTKNVFEFRHDRILEHQLSQTMAQMMGDGDIDIEKTLDPFFTQITGRALVVHQVSDRILDLTSKLLPTSFVAALSYLPFDGSFASGRLCQRAREFLTCIDTVPNSARDDAFHMLANTDSPHVRSVTEDIDGQRDVQLARLRNGDAVAGAAALCKDFYPSTNYPWLESLISQASTRHRGELACSIRSLLTDPGTSNDIRIGALVLAGYLGYDDFEKILVTSWKSTIASPQTVLAAVWAALRCTDVTGSGELLCTVLPSIFTVSDEKSSGGWSERHELFKQLAFSARHGFTPYVVAKLQALAAEDGRYSDFVFAVFEEIDDPIALEFVVTTVARIAAKPVGEGMISRATIWEGPWRRGAGFRLRPLPQAGVEALESLWQPDRPDWLRKYAFKLWIRFSGDALWTAQLPDALATSAEAIWERGLRGDRRVTAEVVQSLRKRPHSYQLVRHIWTSDFESIMDSDLKTGNWWAIHALRDVPESTAERLIISNWAAIYGTTEGIQAALYVATPQTLSLVSNALSQAPELSKMLTYVYHYFGFGESGRSDRLSQRHLNALRPYLARISSHGLFHMVRFCGQNGFREWADRELLPECRRRLTEGADGVLASAVWDWFPTDEDLLSELDRIARDRALRPEINIWFWAERFVERLNDPGRLSAVLGRWLAEECSAQRFRLAALAIRYQGSRGALPMLRRFFDADVDGPLREYYLDAAYGVMRRSLN
jgi:hypothetical protein